MTSYRAAIAEIVEGIVRDIPESVKNSLGLVSLEIDTDEQGEVIQMNKQSVFIRFCLTRQTNAGDLDFTLFELDFFVYGRVDVLKFNRVSCPVIHYIKTEFDKSYSVVKQVIKEKKLIEATEKKEQGFNRALNQLKEGIKGMNQVFDYKDKIFQVYPYLLDKGFDMPTKNKEWVEWMEDFKKNNSDVYVQMVADILQADEWVEMIGKKAVLV